MLKYGQAEPQILERISNNESQGIVAAQEDIMRDAKPRPNRAIDIRHIFQISKKSKNNIKDEHITKK